MMQGDVCLEVLVLSCSELSSVIHRVDYTNYGRMNSFSKLINFAVPADDVIHIFWASCAIFKIKLMEPAAASSSL